jgi:hypothetical protein
MKGHFGELGIDETKILKRMLSEYDSSLWSGFNRLIARFSDEFL